MIRTRHGGRALVRGARRQQVVHAVVVAAAVVSTLGSLDLAYPKVGPKS